MIHVFTTQDATPQVWKVGDDAPSGTVWVDLVQPSDDEVQHAEDCFGLSLPGRDSIARFGRSMGDRDDAETLHLHMALFADDAAEKQPLAPLALVLTGELLVSLRYGKSEAFAAMDERLSEQQQTDSVKIFTLLMQTIVEQMASRMQDIASDLSKSSDRVFRGHRLRTAALRRAMLDIGDLERRLNRVGASLMGLGRMLGFTCNQPIEWMSESARRGLNAVSDDMAVLDEFDKDLTAKLSFQLNAILGFINTDQNEVMKLLTVVSVATVPPLILGAIWGMNFEHMPELTWLWGYPLALLLIVISIALPVAWFKWRGWLSDDANGDDKNKGKSKSKDKKS